MTTPPMRTPRSARGIPGFDAPPPEQDRAPSCIAELDPRGGTRQLNVRVLVPLMERYRGLVRDLDAAGYGTSLTELVQAVLS